MKLDTLQRDSLGALPDYAWPGGYPIIYLDKDNSVMCAKCATKVLDSEYGDSFVPVEFDIYYEGPVLSCEDCNKLIESAYGDPDNDE